ncbi:winged helix-turn-helix domain-containing protein [Pseudoalteromonas sp. OANN1]|uniref:winged helix-turn-helix domain-containing protein n=1 Tax=unclassified Pseudoalteromonas TaxID=194690 RepID=UPI002097BCA7|nr:winged helix-turn-helix domain-containing protein [Pseudoalteromonas sp. OANN1]MCO7200340.1 winged helix-turn-helix domain-containing protein [Pseudoalteromonas sp. OANN1]
MNEVNFPRKVKEVKFGEWTLDPRRQCISDGEVERELEPLLFNILCYLAINCDQIITRQDLIDDVWRQNYVDDNAINRAMSELRKVLKSDRQKGTIVKTHYRKGYSFFVEPIVIYHEESDVYEASATKTEVPLVIETDPLKPKNSKFAFASIFSFVLICLVGFGYFYSASEENKQQAIPEFNNKHYEEQALSWMDGQYNILLLSPDKNYAAFSFIPEGQDKSYLVVKDLRDGKEQRVGEAKFHYFPMGWASDSSSLFYRVIDVANKSCKVWRISRDFSSSNSPLFDCELRITFGTGVGENSFIYTKSNYRNRDELSALVNRNLLTGEEFQITSPNINSHGDHFLHYSEALDSVFFERRQLGYSELYMTGAEGGNLVKLYESKSRIWSANYDSSRNTLIWMQPFEKKIYEYSLTSKQLVNTIQVLGESRYSSYQSIDWKNMLVVGYPYLHQLNELDIESLTFTELKKEIAYHRSSSPKENGYFAVAVENGKSTLFELDLEGAVVASRLSVEEPFDVETRKGFDEILLKFQDRLEVYNTQSWKLEESIQTSGRVISAEFLHNGDIAYVTENKSKNKAFIYSKASDLVSTLPVQDALWLSSISKDLYVSLSTKDKVEVFDRNLGESIAKIPLSKAFSKHKLTVAGNMIYHTDGYNIYQIDYQSKQSTKLIFTLPSQGTIKGIEFHEGKLLVDVIKPINNHLFQLKYEEPAEH